jgi:hypothetical protein
MPTAYKRMRSDYEAILAAFHIECQNCCPELGMYAQMRSPLGRNLCPELRVLKPRCCKDMKRQLTEIRSIA